MRRKRFPGWDWRIWGSSLLTILWLGAGAAYLATAVGWSFWQAEVDDIGGFFEGFFAPLAFLWLVVGLFIQQKELARTRDEMERANVLSAQQAAAIEASALTARQQAFFLIAENVRRQTGNLLGAMLASHENDLVGSKEELEEHLAAHAAGDFERFPRLFLNFDSALGEGNFGRVGADADFFFGSPFRASLSDEYVRSFRRLLRLARECDTGDAIRGTVTHAAHGLVYGAMLSELRAPEAWLLLDGPVPEGPPVDVAGAWRVVFDPDARDNPGASEFTLSLRDGHGGLEGAVRSVLGEAAVEAPAVSGNALFFRVNVGGPVLFCATVEEGRMQGRGETQYGDVYTFTASPEEKV